MSVATLQQLSHDLPSLLELLRRGETVAITDGQHIVARLMPAGAEGATNSGNSAASWPDFAARRKAMFGDKVLPAGTVQELIDEDRGE